MRPLPWKAALSLAWLFVCWGFLPANASALTYDANGAEFLLLHDAPNARAGEARLRAIGSRLEVGFERAALLWTITDETGQRALVRIDFPAGAGLVTFEARRAEVVAERLTAGAQSAPGAYHEVRHRAIAPGADLVHRAREHRLVAEVRIEADANLEAVRLRWRGVNGLELDDRGGLEIHTPAGVTHQNRPKLFQERAGRRVEVPGGFRVVGGTELGFWAGPHDASRPLILEWFVLE